MGREFPNAPAAHKARARQSALLCAVCNNRFMNYVAGIFENAIFSRCFSIGRKTNKPSCRFALRMQIVGQLIIPFGFVRFTSPNFQLYDEFFFSIEYNHIHTAVVPRARFNDVMAGAVNTWAHKAEKEQPSFALDERLILFCVLSFDAYGKSLNDFIQIEAAIPNKKGFVFANS